MKLSHTFKKAARSWPAIGAYVGLAVYTMLFPGTRISYDLETKGGEPLNSNEVALVKGVFGDEIRTENIRKHLHNENDEIAAASVRSGSHRHIDIWGPRFHANDYAYTDNAMHFLLFMHEMTHIWQNQNTVYLANLIRGNDGNYDYELDESSRFKDFSREQQACIIQDYAVAFLFLDDDRYEDSTNPDYKKHLKRVVEERFPQAAKTRMIFDMLEYETIQEEAADKKQAVPHKTPRLEGHYPRGIKAVPGV